MSYQVARLEAEIRIRGISGSTGDGFQLSTDMSADQPEPRGRMCGAVYNGGINGKVSIRDLDVTGNWTFHMDSTTPFQLATGLDTSLRWTPSRGSGLPFLCDYNNTLGTTTALTGVPATQAGTSIGVRVDTITAELHYLLAYGAACPAIAPRQ